MSHFDIIESASKAYTTIWEERVYLAKMAIVPLVVKMICVFITLEYVDGNNIIRQALVMFPAYFTEGWLLAHLARFIVLGQRWPFKPSGDTKSDILMLHERARGVLSGTVCFILVNFAMAGFFTLFMYFIPLGVKPEEVPPESAMAGLFLSIMSLFLFRYVWFYIPLALNVAPIYYLRKVQKISITMRMIGLWILCFIPAMILMQFLSTAIIGPNNAPEAMSMATEISVTIVRVVIDTVKNMLVTAAMAYAIMGLFQLKNPAEDK